MMLWKNIFTSSISAVVVPTYPGIIDEVTSGNTSCPIGLLLFRLDLANKAGIGDITSSINWYGFFAHVFDCVVAFDSAAHALCYSSRFVYCRDLPVRAVLGILKQVFIVKYFVCIVI